MSDERRWCVREEEKRNIKMNNLLFLEQSLKLDGTQERKIFPEAVDRVTVSEELTLINYQDRA